MQVKLLRLLETNTYRSVGSTQLKRANFRLVCATHKNIPALVTEGKFRQDLYYRINAFPINLPSLNERREDIPLIARSLLKKLSPTSSFHITESAMRLLKSQNYDGNIRELRNILERAIIYAKSNVVDISTLELCLEKASSNENTTQKSLRENEKQYLQELLQHCNNDKQKQQQ